MEQLLAGEFPAFLRSYDAPRTHALRTNTLKIRPEELGHHLGPGLSPVPWAAGGLYYGDAIRPGRHPFHAAGLYYIQEPSAMAVAPILDPQPGERVLDLCAAPGGKSTHLAALMQDRGLIVTNEISPKRVRTLVENLERMGLRSAIVLNERPDRLASKWPGFFDRILVDAPCSGEGMFRKLPESCSEWTPESPASCGQVQKAILAEAVRMLRPGGRLVYSTCTFAPEENEQVMLHLLQTHPEMRLLDLPALPGLAPAQPGWTADPERARALGVQRAGRLWPHRVQGEGHFVALLEKRVEGPAERAAHSPVSLQRGRGDRTPRGKGKARPDSPHQEVVSAWQRFYETTLTTGVEFEGSLLLHGDWLYLLPQEPVDLDGLHVLRAGLQLGQILKGRFEPAHGLALTLRPGQARQTHDLDPHSPAVLAYLRGEALPASGQSGWTLVTTAGFPLGWAKASDGLLKNHYPKGLRWPSGAGGSAPAEGAL